MPYVIGSRCADITDLACVQVCPVDCIYEGSRKLYIHPDECIDCGACESECPQSAIFFGAAAPSDQAEHVADNAAFFALPLPGRTDPLGQPGGAEEIGSIGIDTPLVESLPPQQS